MKKNYKSLVFVVLTAFLISILAAGVSAFAGGDGSSGSPYQITTCTELQAMNTHLNANYVLANDIACSDTINWNLGAGFVPIGTFAGTFDGQGYKITGLFISRPSTDYVGLFGFIGSGAIIKNVGLVDVNIAGRYYVGGLVGQNYQGTITNSYATGSVTGSYVGGLVGYNFYGTITNSYATGSVTGSYGVGGLVGMNNMGPITNSYATGSVVLTGSGNSRVGGLVGHNYQGTITNSYATGSVTGSVTSSNHVGGLVGENDGPITNSYATGSVTGTQYVGGLVGYNHQGTITNSYATGSVTGSYVGGLVGYNYQGTITNSYWYNEQTICCGSGTCTGCTKAGAISNFYSSSHDVYDTNAPTWNFVNIWAINEGVNYPYLRWQIPPVLCGNGVVEAGEECDDGNLIDGDGCSSTCTVEAAACPYGMVSYWTFDEGSGSTAADSVGTNNGQLINGPIWTTGKVGNALQFDGVNDYVAIPDSDNWHFGTGDMAIEGWLKTSSNGEIIYQGNSEGTWNTVSVILNVGSWNSGKLQFVPDYSNYPYYHIITSSNNINDNTWHYFVITRTNNVFKMYIDAIQTGGDLNLPSYSMVNSDQQLYMGAMPGPSTYWPLNGVLDEVAIYNRALTANEIQQQYNNGLAGKGYTTEVCNGIDDDCDGVIDNGLTLPTQSCTVGVGACQNTGTQEKTCGGIFGWSDWGSCSVSPGSPTGPDNNCNGIDENCDGTADNVYTPTTTNCGIGACAATGQLICDNGATKDTCTAGTPTTETCDNVDNDCDSITDEDLTRGTACGIGACGSTGTETCAAGLWVGDTCKAGTPTIETCDNKDNDCDGTVDESLTRTTRCGLGVCSSNTGKETCTAGIWGGNTCNPLAGAITEVCDDKDNDCDGKTDESPCTAAIYCSNINIKSIMDVSGMLRCTIADWQKNEKGRLPNDCRVNFVGSGRLLKAVCVATTNAN